MLNIEEASCSKPCALFNLGFRPFFLLAGVSSAILMLAWMWMHSTGTSFLPADFSPMLWHGHEMVFGYSIAVISGFLLAAIKNWTNRQTLHGNALFALALLWLSARILPFTDLDSALFFMAVTDLLFMLGLLAAIASPVIQSRQWKQFPIILKVGLIAASNLLFYLGFFNITPPETIQWGLYSGLYLIVSLIMLMGRRVIPFFIEKGVDETTNIRNYKWLDISSTILFIAFWIVEVFIANFFWAGLLAAILFLLHGIRLVGWYTPGIWKKPLLWVLYIGYGFIVSGFGLKAVTTTLDISPWLSVHAFAAGGIGLITLGMMSRVALGHTGRNVFELPALVKLAFGFVIVAACVRVILPLLLPQFYAELITVSQGLWIIGFGLFVFVYAPMLIRPRVDGRYG
ncbi:MAG: NnrS family protein [Gammaproteobacteria bacterium]